MNEGIGDAIGSLFSGTAPVSWSDLLFPVQVTGAAVVSGVTVYSWTEQTPHPVDGQLQDAYPGRSGTATLAPAFELNNGAVLRPPFYAWCRPRGIFGGCMAYDLLPPLGTSGTFYNTYEQYISGEETFGPGTQTYFLGPGSTVNYGTAGPTGQPAPVVNYFQDTPQNIYPGTVWLLQTLDGSGTPAQTVLQVTVDALGVVTLFTDADWSSVAGAADGKVYVTVNDTVKDYLASTLTAGSGITLTVINPGSDETLEVATTGPTWVKYTFTYTDFSIAATTKSVNVRTMGPRDVLHHAVVKTTTGWTGGSLSAVTAILHTAGGAGSAVPSYDAHVSPTDNHIGEAAAPSVYMGKITFAGWTITLEMQSTGANLDAATAGAIEVDLLVSTLP